MNFKTDGESHPTDGFEEKDGLDLAQSDAKQIVLSAGFFFHRWFP